MSAAGPGIVEDSAVMNPDAAETRTGVAVPSPVPGPPSMAGIRKRLALTVFSAGQALLGIAALVLLVLTLLSIVLAPLGIGLLLANAVVPATALLTRLHRRLAGLVLGESIDASYAPAPGRDPLRWCAVWFRDPARWRDFAFLAFAATGGFVLSGLVAVSFGAPLVYLSGLLIDGSAFWWVLLLGVGPVLGLIWWLVTPALVRARALAERGILGSRTTELERRVAEVTTSRAETLDHSAAEIRRIERDLHDGAQARIVSLGMHLGMAEQLMSADPVAAAALLRAARESTVTALEDLRSVVRGIHPPALADRGLSGAVAALAEGLALPVTVRDSLIGRAPAPIESAVYFAVAECLANSVKHAAAQRSWITVEHTGGLLRVVVGDDGIGGANAAGSGLAGVSKRLAAFDGTIAVDSPAGGPTIVTLEVPCGLSLPKTTPSSATDSPGS